jgi:hypothetical protein
LAVVFAASICFPVLIFGSVFVEGPRVIRMKKPMPYADASQAVNKMGI